MTMQWIFGWWNLIFIAPFAVAIVYLLAAVLTGVGMTDADADHDVDADTDHDVDADADAESDADHDAEVPASVSTGAGVLAWLGLGRVPLSLLITAALLTWGAAGFITNALLQGRDPAALAIWSIPVAATAALLIVRLLALIFTRYVRLNESSARPMRHLIGCQGQALYVIDDRFGMAQVRGRTGELFQVPCRVGDQVPPIPKGTPLRLVAYSAAERTFYAIPG